MPESEVIRIMKSFKADLAAGERAQVAEMAQKWQGVERRLQAQIDALAMEMTNIARDGGTVSRGMLSTSVRYQELLIQLREELDGYTDYAEQTIEQRQAQLGRLGIRHAEQAITTQGIAAGFNKLPVSAVQNMVGLTGAGTPLRTLLEASWPLSAQRLTEELVTGVALGYNPRKTARNMAQGMGATQKRMEVIARTEQLRVYREANRQSYARSGVVTGYKRLATHDRRVCAACLMDEGTFYPVGEEMPEHPQGRCTMVPVVSGVPDPQWQQGEAWFVEQPKETQVAILGKERFEAWKGGQFTLDDLVTVKPNATWGPSLQVTPLRDLAGQGGRQEIVFEPATNRLTLSSAPEKLMRLYGFSPPTDEQRRMFTNAIDALSPPIQGMWGSGDVILAISPERYLAQHQSKWIMLGESSITIPESVQHEFIHHIMGQARFREALPQFRPSTTLFRHAAESSNSLDEEITMILTKYHPDPATWQRNIVNESYDVLNNGQAVTPEVADGKVRDTVAFLRSLGVEL